MEEVGNESRQLLTEKGTIGNFYEKVIEQHIPNFLAEERKSWELKSAGWGKDALLFGSSVF